MISVVIPVYNEAANLPDLWTRLAAVMKQVARPWEVVFIDDGSSDDSLKMLKQFADEMPGHVRVVELSRNFGQHSAILAGFKQSKGDIVVTLDADLQNPPEEIPRLMHAIDEGNDVVGGWREERQDQAFRRIASQLSQQADLGDRRRSDARLRMHAARIPAAHRRCGGGNATRRRHSFPRSRTRSPSGSLKFRSVTPSAPPAAPSTICSGWRLSVSI